VLHPLALIDLLSFAPSLLGAVLPHMGMVAPWGLDLRWFRVFRYSSSGVLIVVISDGQPAGALDSLLLGCTSGA
jgi:hypothetical protein